MQLKFSNILYNFDAFKKDIHKNPAVKINREFLNIYQEYLKKFDKIERVFTPINNVNLSIKIIKYLVSDIENIIDLLDYSENEKRILLNTDGGILIQSICKSYDIEVPKFDKKQIESIIYKRPENTQVNTFQDYDIDIENKKIILYIFTKREARHPDEYGSYGKKMEKISDAYWFELNNNVIGPLKNLGLNVICQAK